MSSGRDNYFSSFFFFLLPIAFSKIPFNVAPDLVAPSPNLAINDFCKSSIIHNKIRITSNGMPQRDFIHLDDVVNGVSKLVNLKKRMPNIMNLTSGNTLNLLEIAHKVYQNNKQTNLMMFLLLHIFHLL